MGEIVAETGEPAGLAERLRHVIEAMPGEKQLEVLRYLGEKARKHQRKKLMITAECETDRYLGRAYVYDISLGGALLHASDPFDLGQRLTLRLPFETDERLDIGGTVVREAERGFGVAFIDVTWKQERRLKRFVEGLEA